MYCNSCCVIWFMFDVSLQKLHIAVAIAYIVHCIVCLNEDMKYYYPISNNYCFQITQFQSDIPLVFLAILILTANNSLLRE
jgi:hypothetical protein